MDNKEDFNCNKLVVNIEQGIEVESCNDKLSLIGIRRQKSGRYAARITDPIRHKKVWLGTFDTIEEASQAYFAKKSEFHNEKLSHQGSKKGKRIHETLRFGGVHKKKKRGKYYYESTSPISKKRVWLGTFGAAEEGSWVDHQSKKLEFELDGKLEVDVSISNADNVGIDRRIDCHEIGTAVEASRVFDSCLMANVRGAESSDECNVPRNGDPKDKISLVGTRREKSGRYSARITDPIMHTKVHLGTFDTIEQASQAYLSKKSEFEKIRKGNKVNKPKNNCDRIQQPESPSVVETVNTAASCDPKAMRSLVGIRRRKNGRYFAEITDPIKHQKVYLGTFNTIEEASQAYLSKKSEFEKLRQGNKDNKPKKNCDQILQPESTSVLETLNTATSCDPKDKSLVGIRRRKNGRYFAEITDPIKHQKVYLGTFDTIEQASQACLSKKSEFEKLRQGNKDNKTEPEPPSVVASLDTAVSASGRDKRIGSRKRKAHTVGVNKSKTIGRYTSEITNPITKKKIWLGTFDTAEEASHAYQSKKLEFQNLVKAKQQQCTKAQTHSEQDAAKEKSVNVEQGHENVNCEPFQLESYVGSPDVDVLLSNASSGETVQSTDSDKIGNTEEAFHVYQSKKLDDSESPQKVELQSNTQTDSSAGEKQEGQEDDEDLWMGEWMQLPGNRAVKFSLKLGLPIIDNYGYLLGEFSSLDDLSICETEDDN
ncbi:hypothetical protein P3S68_000198 [Capsicum galapagoense]